MGLITTQIELRNPLDSRLAPFLTSALVDTGAMHLCVPRNVAVQLGLQTVQQREVTTADGTRHVCDYVGPVEVAFQNRSCFVGALVLGEEVFTRRRADRGPRSGEISQPPDRRRQSRRA